MPMLMWVQVWVCTVAVVVVRTSARPMNVLTEFCMGQSNVRLGASQMLVRSTQMRGLTW